MSLTLSDIFRMPTAVVYPPFKNGLYMEEAFYFFYQANKEIFERLPYVYIPAFWTNFQIHPQFQHFKHLLQTELDEAVKAYSVDQKFFTIVQHDDAVLLRLPPNTLIFGACSGHIPLPLIYEDRKEILNSRPKLPYEEKSIQLSFIGSETHTLRKVFRKYIEEHSTPWFVDINETHSTFQGDRSELFLKTTQKSKFSLAPRGYGRSSFRFFEIFLLGSIPVYIYDDIEWLPYKDILDYKKFCISIPINELPTLQEKLDAITKKEYDRMWEYYQSIKEYFTLFGMSRYIYSHLATHPSLDIQSLPYYKGQN